MAYMPMYKGINNSPIMELVGQITATDTEITVSAIDKLPDAPNTITIGNDENAELVLYNGKNFDQLTGCVRGFNGTLAQMWGDGTVCYRGFTEYDYAALIANLEALKADTKTWIEEIIRSIVVDRVVYADLYESGGLPLATSAGDDLVVDKKII